VEIQWQVVKLL